MLRYSARLALLAAAFPGFAPAVLAQAGEEVTAVLVDLAEARDNPKSRRGAIQSLVALGPGQLFAVRTILTGGHALPHGESPLLDDDSLEVLGEVLRKWPRERVLTHLTHVDAATSTSERLWNAKWIGELGQAEHLGSLIDLGESLDVNTLGHPRIAADVERALTGVLGRDPAAYGVLSSQIDRAQRSAIPLARALGEVGDPRGLDLLGRLQGRSEALDLVVLEVLGNWEIWRSGHEDGTCAELARPFLYSPKPRVRRQAATALGRLRDVAAVEELITLLDDDDARVRRGAHWALENITGHDQGRDPVRWRGWLEAERKWFTGRARDCMRAATGANAPRTVRALGEMARHPLFRRELSASVVRALVAGDEHVQSVACATLAKLGDMTALEPLLTVMDGGRSELRNVACAALRAITAEDLPVDAKVWRARFAE